MNNETITSSEASSLASCDQSLRHWETPRLEFLNVVEKTLKIPFGPELHSVASTNYGPS
jgi:hypothetical protein